MWTRTLLLLCLGSTWLACRDRDVHGYWVRPAKLVAPTVDAAPSEPGPTAAPTPAAPPPKPTPPARKPTAHAGASRPSSADAFARFYAREVTDDELQDLAVEWRGLGLNAPTPFAGFFGRHLWPFRARTSFFFSRTPPPAERATLDSTAPADGPVGAPPPTHAHRLTITGDSGAELASRGLELTIRIDGFRARVAFAAHYYNDRDRQLEGTFQLALPPGAVPHHLAFGPTSALGEQPADLRPRLPDAGLSIALAADAAHPDARTRLEDLAQVKPARMVPREHARWAYRATVARAVDPALLEWCSDGVYSTSVFPLVPGKLHRVEVGYDLDLTPVAGGYALALDLPADVPALSVTLGIALVDGATITATTGDGEPLPCLRRESGRAWHHVADPRTRRITAQVAYPSGSPTLVHDAKGIGPCWAARLVAELPTDDERPPTKRGVFVLDVSHATTAERLERRLELAGELLERARPALREFAVLVFDVDRWWWRERWTPNEPAEVEAFLTMARDSLREGASALDVALAAAAAPAWDPTARGHALFVLGDGVPTWGERDASRLASGLASPVHGYYSRDEDHAASVLDELAAISGGVAVPIDTDLELAHAATAHAAPAWKLESLALDGASDVLVAGRPRWVRGGQALVVAGRGTPAPGAPLRLSVSHGDKRRELGLALGAPVVSDLAERTYGQIAVAQLERHTSASPDVTVAYARHFRVVGRTCSLLMLESEAEYARFGIRAGDDARVVATSPATPVIEQLERAAARRERDAKTRVLTAIDRSGDGWPYGDGQRFPGAWRMSLALRGALERLPIAAFEVPRTPLAGRTRQRSQVSAPYLAALDAGALDPAAIIDEAVRRAATDASDGVRALTTLVGARGDRASHAAAHAVALCARTWNRLEDVVPLLESLSAAQPAGLSSQWLAEAHAAAGRHALALCLDERLEAYAAGYGSLDAHRRRDRLLAIAELEDVLTLARERGSDEPRDLGSDLAVVAYWSRASDVDLEVVEPGGEVCGLERPESARGGLYRHDVRGAPGPEIYVMTEAAPGAYVVRLRRHPSEAAAGGDAVALVEVHLQRGRADERIVRHVVRVPPPGASVDVTTVEVAARR